MSTIEQQNVANSVKSLACREKYWEELQDGEKIERLRNELANALSRLADAQSSIAALSKHEHAQNGRVMIAAFEGGMLGESPRFNRQIPYGLRTERDRR